MRLPTSVLLLLLAGCVGIGPQPDYDPDIAPEDFVEGINHPFLPLVPGAFWTYESVTDEGTETIAVRVLDETREVNGVQATVVRDTVTIDGELDEDTWDWFAQDKDGNVWYLGEDTCAYEGGECIDEEGAWEWGIDGALPGMIMPADPAPGEPFFMEFYWPEAIDEAQVIDTGRTISGPTGSYSDTVTIKEWTRLGGGVEHAHYARGVGLVLKETTNGETQEVLVEHGP